MRILVVFLACIAVGLASGSSAADRKSAPPGNTKAEASEAAAPPTLPEIIELRPTPKSADEIRAEAKDRAERREADQESIKVNQQIAKVAFWQLVIFALQLAVFGYQAYKLRQTVSAADRQVSDMRESIAQATRAAEAMENMASNLALSARAAADSVATVKERTALQMRAYLSITIGNAIYQERARNLKFEGKPSVINTGNTPAHDVRYAAKAAILPVPLPRDFELPPPTNENLGGATVGPHQPYLLSAVVANFVDDSKVDAIKGGHPESLYIWGFVTYKDVFGEEHRTDFCQQTFWVGTQVMGYYTPGRNDAT